MAYSLYQKIPNIVTFIFSEKSKNSYIVWPKKLAETATTSAVQILA